MLCGFYPIRTKLQFYLYNTLYNGLKKMRQKIHGKEVK